MQGQQESSVEIFSSLWEGTEGTDRTEKRSEVPVDYSYTKKEEKIPSTNILLYWVILVTDANLE